MVGVDMEQDGIDRLLLTPRNDTITAQYKADFWSRQTGNMFLETSIQSDTKPWADGWAMKCKADVVLYWSHPGSQRVESNVYVLNVRKLKRWFENNKDNYPLRIIPNEGFVGEGFLVPIPLVYKHCGIKKLTMKMEFLA